MFIIIVTIAVQFRTIGVQFVYGLRLIIREIFFLSFNFADVFVNP